MKFVKILTLTTTAILALSTNAMAATGKYASQRFASNNYGGGGYGSGQGNYVLGNQGSIFTYSSNGQIKQVDLSCDANGNTYNYNTNCNNNGWGSDCTGGYDCYNNNNCYGGSDCFGGNDCYGGNNCYGGNDCGNGYYGNCNSTCNNDCGTNCGDCDIFGNCNNGNCGTVTEPEIPGVTEPEIPGITEPEIPGITDPETPGTTDPGTTNPEVSAYAQEVVDLVNAERAKQGLAPVEIDMDAMAAAQVRAKEVKVSFSHTRPNGTSCFTALDEAGASYRGAGENIALGQKTPQQVMNDWMNSEGHRANILNGNFKYIGVGVDGNSWTQLFTY